MAHPPRSGAPRRKTRPTGRLSAAGKELSLVAGTAPIAPWRSIWCADDMASLGSGTLPMCPIVLMMR